MLYVMRHGQTDWNVENRLQGQTNIPLNETGRQMARDASAKYADLPIDRCITSTLDRTRETARIFLTGRRIPVTEDERLCEIGFGPWEGRVDPKGDPTNPVGEFYRDTAHYRAPEGAETLEHMIARANTLVREVFAPALRGEEDLLIVTHGGFGRILRCVLTGKSLADGLGERLGNCEIVSYGLPKVK